MNRVAYGLDSIGLISLSQERLRKSDHINPLSDMNDFRAVAAAAGFRLNRALLHPAGRGGCRESRDASGRARPGAPC